MHILNSYIFYMIFLDIIFNRKIFYEMTFIDVFKFFFIFTMRQMHLTIELVNFQVDDNREIIQIGKRHSNVPKPFKHLTWPSNALTQVNLFAIIQLVAFLFQIYGVLGELLDDFSVYIWCSYVNLVIIYSLLKVLRLINVIKLQIKLKNCDILHKISIQHTTKASPLILHYTCSNNQN